MQAGKNWVLPSLVMVIWRIMGFNSDVALHSICSGGVWKLLLRFNKRWLVVSRRPRMVVGRPLPPSSPSDWVSSGRCARVNPNLQASMTSWRPLSSPGASYQVVTSPSTIPLAARRRAKAVVKELDLMAFSLFFLGSFVQNVQACA
jgi:hypothetical protein